MEATSQKPKRILSIDLLRGLTLFLMLFVNDLYEPGVPDWLAHTKAEVDGMGLADWVFPGFLFMVGMAIPYAIGTRKKQQQASSHIFGHILLRSLSLLLIGVLMLNIGRLNEELSGINRSLWAILVYLSIFLIWNDYPGNVRLKNWFTALRLLGIAGLCALAFVFRAGDLANTTWLEPGWWGILGLIGWGYFVSASVYLLVGERIAATAGVWFFFIVLNMLSQWGSLNGLDFLNPVFGVIISGNVPSIVLAGLLVSLILRRGITKPASTVVKLLTLGTFCFLLGFLLRHWFIISKIYGTPSWAMICNGISIWAYTLLYLLVDHWGIRKWAGVFQSAGKNSLTTYLAPDVIYFSLWGLGLPLFFYKQAANPLLAVGGSLVWAMAMICFSILLSKVHIRLKL